MQLSGGNAALLDCFMLMVEVAGLVSFDNLGIDYRCISSIGSAQEPPRERLRVVKQGQKTGQGGREGFNATRQTTASSMQVDKKQNERQRTATTHIAE